MKKIGGPHDGEAAVIAVHPGDPELKVPGSVLEYDFTDPEKVALCLYIDVNPAPSIGGAVERYQYREEPEEAWYYVEPKPSLPDPSSADSSSS
jgi:hypothetical protein